MSYIRQFLSLAKKQSLTTVFFAILAAGLFMGDGKQMMIDAYGAGGLIILSLYAKYYLKKQRDISSVSLWAWMLFVMYLVVRTFYSDDIGYSVYAGIRYVEAFMLYYLFTIYSDEETPKYFATLLLIFSVVALASAVIITLVPSWSTFLPLMNMLYPNYGHNHVVDVLIFSLPVSAILWLHSRKFQYVMMVALAVLGTIFSFARAALALEAAFLIILLGYFLRKKIFVHKTFIVIILLSIFMAITMLFIPFTRLNRSVVISPKFSKQPISQDVRTKYWQQAFSVVFERPWFGSGPGTFYLQSMRLQKAPSSYSWFAHSYPLEFLSETGIVGFILLLFVIVSVLRGGRAVRHKPYMLALYIALSLVVAESFVDYNLNYLVVWLLLWATGGVIFFKSDKPPASRFVSTLCYGISLFAVMVFYVAMLLSFFGKTVFFDTQIHKLLCAVDSSCVVRAFSNTDKKQAPTIEANFEQYVLFFHPRNPETMLSLARYTQSAERYEESYDLYQKTVELDPKNVEMIEEYASLLLADHAYDRLFELVKASMINISRQVHKDTEFLTNRWEHMYPCFDENALLWPSKEKSPYSYQAKVLYYAGLCLLRNGQSDDARRLFKIAVDARESWSNIYIDYAGLSLWEYNDEEEAKRAMDLCRINQYAKKHCSDYDNTLMPMISVTDQDVLLVH